MLVFTVLVCAGAGTQTSPPPEGKLQLRAVLLLTAEFCTSKLIHGGAVDETKNGLEVGEAACIDLEPPLKNVFAELTAITDEQKKGDAQLVLIPKFVDVGVRLDGITAFSNQKLTLLLEWTAKDAAGRTVWLETVKGSATRHIGNMFTAGKNLKVIVDDAVKDAATESARKISSSKELQALSP